MKRAALILSVLMLAAGCGSKVSPEASPTTSEAAATSVVDSTSSSAPPSTSAVKWQDEYRKRLDAEWNGDTGAEKANLCGQTQNLSDDEVRAAFLARAGDDNIFDKMAKEMGFTPSLAEYREATDIAVKALRSHCK